ncbi:DNA-binding domain-containing protein, AraC-type [Desulfosporosinus orientis DSM 765]|uniref:DNA-binding domain-containing protein, AraC-type n=2 Tax=Desulfosporosinus orientis TaxID=1563 RepID=G7WGF5_DESOD|nr:DNA-binding domain-containing protein, AraC-type [Desulfosporosinus orientis DSM 765]
MQSEIEKAVLYVEENLTGNLSLSDVAQYCGYSPYYVSVLFHQAFGETLKSYIKKRRLTCAAEDIKNTQISIINIAIKYGYSSQEAFSRAFADMFGITPNKYRRTKSPIQVTYKKRTSIICGNEGNGVMNNIVRNLQVRIEEKYPVNILHVLNGLDMLKKFKKSRLINEKQTYVPFNEAMCWGETAIEIFSDSFIEKRVNSLKTTEAEYHRIVLEPLKPIFNKEFDIIVLWFGDDMFCQINLITILAYLEQIKYQGDVLFCMALERISGMFPDAFEIDINGYVNIYEAVLCEHKMPDSKVLPVTYQAIKMYLNYMEEESPILKYIRSNLGKENLMAELFALFPEYGLGDLQYQGIIDGNL